MDVTYGQIAENLDVGESAVFSETQRREHPYSWLIGWQDSPTIMHQVTRETFGYSFCIVTDAAEYHTMLGEVR